MLILFIAPAFAADLSVDVINGGLAQAREILEARTGVRISYEGVPRNMAGLHYTTRQDGVNVLIVDKGLAFTYPSTATPQEALVAAVAAWNAQPGVYATFHVAVSDGWLNVIPDHVRTSTGAMVPYKPVLDTVLTIPTSGTATELYRSWVAALGKALGQPVDDALERYGINDPDAEPITLRTGTNSARALLDDIIAQSDTSTWRWQDIVPDGAAGGWQVMPERVRPEDEAGLNRTPLHPPPPRKPAPAYDPYSPFNHDE